MKADTFSNLTVLNHPLVKRDVTMIRDAATSHEHFRSAVKRISTLLAAEIMQFADNKEIEVQTPLEVTKGHQLFANVVLCPVLRAGLGMVSGFLALVPDAKVGHVGIQRNEETLEPVVYYEKAPKSIPNSKVIVLDPMLATGGSAESAIKYLRSRGAKDISFACLVAAPEGAAHLEKTCPDVKVFAASLDRCLNDKGYILPGLGDAGDRMFGTLE